MIFDQTNMLSDRQDIHTTQASTHVIDLGEARIARNIGAGVQIPLLVQVVEDFNNLDTLTVRLESSEDAGFSNPKALWAQSLALADLKAGTVIKPEFIPRGTMGRYLRLNYIVSGSVPSQGAITAGVTMGNQ